MDSYRKYDPSLPSWFINKPKKFVNHCKERLNSASYIAKKHVRILDISNLLFSVKSSLRSDEYRVELGVDQNFPSCECDDWKKTLLPCKHMLSVIQHVDGVSWESFSKRYRESPFINVDHSVSSPPSDDEVNNHVDDGMHVNDELVICLAELKKKGYPKKSKASVCREILGQLKGLTFTVYDMDALDDLHEALEEALTKFSFFAPREDNLIVEGKSVVRSYKTSKYQELPKAKPKKSSLTGRVGIGAEKRKMSAKIIIPSSPKKEKIVSTVIEEYPSLLDGITCDTDNDVIITDISPPTTIDADDIQITNVLPPSESHLPTMKRRKLMLSNEERSTILDGDMLTDESINIAQNILNDHFFFFFLLLSFNSVNMDTM